MVDKLKEGKLIAFKDQIAVMYDGNIRITYLDGPHRYYAQQRVNRALPETDEKAWGSKWRPKGTTTLLGDTLEKKGLANWMAGLPLKELFGYYGKFTGSNGKEIGPGFSKGGGTLLKHVVNPNLGEWDELDSTLSKNELLAKITSAAGAASRRTKQGADIGSLVHDAIEQYVLGTPFQLTLDRYEQSQEFVTPAARLDWLEVASDDLVMAIAAFERFKLWWEETKPELINAEQIVYSQKLDISGAYDALLKIDGRIIVTDWKTSNASVSAGAPQGVYYSYFIQSAIYALCLLEMGAVERIDDLMIVSARKDGEFDAIFASEVSLSVIDAIAWAESVIFCYRMMDKTKQQLINLGTLRG